MLNSLMPGNKYKLKGTRSSLVDLIASQLFDISTNSDELPTAPYGTHFNENWIKCIWKWHLQNVRNFLVLEVSSQNAVNVYWCHNYKHTCLIFFFFSLLELSNHMVSVTWCRVPTPLGRPKIRTFPGPFQDLGQIYKDLQLTYDS